MGLVDNSPVRRYDAQLVIYTSNIFAVLGLRSLFFLLQGAINKFAHLQQGIAIVLIFIGLKMLGEDLITKFINKGSLVYISLIVILVCIAGSIVYSISTADKDTKEEIKLPEDSE
jgi:tellurite resistance protein TerC